MQISSYGYSPSGSTVSAIYYSFRTIVMPIDINVGKISLSPFNHDALSEIIDITKEMKSRSFIHFHDCL